MPGENNSTLEESFVDYQYAIRDRANDSMTGLRHALDTRPALSPEMKRSIPNQPQSPHGVWERARNTEHCDYSYGAAVDRLRYSLKRLEPKDNWGAKDVQFGASFHGYPDAMMHPPPAVTAVEGGGPRPPRGEIPSSEETLPLLQNQSIVVQQLDAENKFCREELQSLKLRVREIVEENRLLHEEIKRGTIHEIMQEGGEGTGMAHALRAEISAVDSAQVKQSLSKKQYSQWHQDVERISAMHTAKTVRLEAQLEHAREELASYEREVEELKQRVRMMESLSSADPNLLQLASGLCVRCAQSEALLAPSGVPGSRVNIDRITKERDDLVEQLTTLKGRYEQLKQREDESYSQVKSSVHLVEQAQLEMTQALVEREQLKEQLSGMRERMEQHVGELQRKVDHERQIIRAETGHERDELHNQVKELGKHLAESQSHLERLSRDKVNLMSEVGHKRGQIDSFDEDYGKATDSMKMSMTQATTERNAAVGQVRRLKQEMDQMHRDRDNERVRLKTELEDLRRRLHEAERELVESKEAAIQHHSVMQSLEREAHLAKMSKECIEKNRGQDLKAITKRAEQREAELNLMIDTVECRHEHSHNELEAIVNAQSTLVLKLREECRRLAGQLEEVTRKYRADNKKLKTNNDYLGNRYEKSSQRLRELEDCSCQHGQLQDKMRERIKQMDQHANHASQQILDLLAKESSLMRDRHLLASEVEFLRRQMSSQDRKEADKYYSATRHLVNEVLNNVRYEQEDKQREVVEEFKVSEDLFRKDEEEESVATPSEDMDDILDD